MDEGLKWECKVVIFLGEVWDAVDQCSETIPTFFCYISLHCRNLQKRKKKKDISQNHSS